MTTAEPIRVALWSGPRNISTALMRSFGARPDTVVIDEPFYAAYLAETGLMHPMRAEILASQSNDWRQVVTALMASMTRGETICYQKHMTHHMLDHFGREWLPAMRNAFLIRNPQAVLASYLRKRNAVTLEDIGIVQQRELFEREADRLGAPPPVIDGLDVLADPPRLLGQLCAALDIPYTDAMLSWPAGRRISDGVWAPAWYQTVEQSTGFSKPAAEQANELPDQLRRIADQAQPHYDALAAFRLR